jgi:(p)ppGpp synthase/HD superfamily hydrolase
MARGASRSLSEQSGRGYPFALENEALRQSGRGQAAILKSAESIAEFAHATQKRRDGSPYMTHVREVVAGVKSPEAKLAAYLHDTMEDGGITAKEMRKEGIPDNVIEAVNALTRPPAEERQMTYQEYIEQIVKPNRIAREVKISDLRSNLKDNDNPGQVKRYERALKALLEG